MKIAFRHSVFASVLVVILAATYSFQATAQDDKNRARLLYQEGESFYQEGAYSEALVKFQEAYEVKAHPVVLKSIAECQFQLNDYIGTIETWEKFVADPGTKAKEKDTARSRIEQCKGLLVKLDVSSEPVGAAVMVDGKPTGKTTPCTLELNPGDHEITFNLEGYTAVVKNRTFAEGSAATVAANFVANAEPATGEGIVDPFADEEGDEEPLINQEEERGGPPAAFWAMTAVAGVGIIGGTVFGTMALNDEKSYTDTGNASDKDNGERNAIIADISFGTAIAAGIVGVIILVANKDKEEDDDDSAARLNVVPVAGSDVIGVSTTVSF